MKIAAAYAIASLVSDAELKPEYILPHAFDPRIKDTVADAVAAIEARPPFAVAVNTTFVPNTRYAAHALQPGDRVEIISPVTGG